LEINWEWAHLIVAVSSARVRLSEAIGHVTRHSLSCCWRRAPLKARASQPRQFEDAAAVTAAHHTAVSHRSSPHRRESPQFTALPLSPLLRPSLLLTALFPLRRLLTRARSSRSTLSKPRWNPGVPGTAAAERHRRLPVTYTGELPLSFHPELWHRLLSHS
jgi:hypothetical protein